MTRNLIRLSFCLVLAVFPSPVSGQDCRHVDFEDFDTAPVLVDSLAPEYPEMAKRARIEGMVVVEVLVNSDGSVCEVAILEQANPLLGSAVKKAAQDAGFAPAGLEGKPVAGAVLLEHEFVWRFEDWIKTDYPEIPWSSPRISEVGTTKDVFTWNGEEVPVWDFEGVEIRGDLPLEVFRQLERFVMSEIREGEVFHSIWHRLALPRGQDPVLEFQWRGDLEVRICTEDWPDGNGCRDFRLFTFKLVDGHYRLAGESMMHLD